MWQIMRFHSGVNVWVVFREYGTRQEARDAMPALKRKFASSRFNIARKPK